MVKKRRKHILVETDILISAIDLADPHHEEAKEIIASMGNMALSPYTLMELNLLIRSGNIVVKNYELFWKELWNIARFYDIDLMTPHPLYHAKAGELRERYNLTYFDSLHASTAIVEEMKLVSFDRKAYEKIKELSYVHPMDYLRGK